MDDLTFLICQDRHFTDASAREDVGSIENFAEFRNQRRQRDHLMRRHIV